jgi:hypothetical protein
MFGVSMDDCHGREARSGPRSIPGGHERIPQARRTRFLFAVGAVSLCLVTSALAAQRQSPLDVGPVGSDFRRIVVFPVENLTGGAAPLREIRAMMMDRLRERGFSLLDEEGLDRALTRHRIRYTAGVDREVARALKDEARVDAVLIPSLELYDDANPPKVALFARLVSTGENPTVRWIDGVGMAGDDAPGILDLKLVEDPGVLLARAVDYLMESVVRQQADAVGVSAGTQGEKKFRPKLVYRSELMDPTRKYSIAVVPFFNKTERRYAGDIIALHMIRNLMRFGNLEVVEPGIVRQELLRFRIIMSDGVSLPETETILNAVNADLVLNGEVLDYRDYRGSDGVAKVDFSVLFIERKSRQVIFSSYSQNQGNDGVIFFDWGRVNTAHAMAAQMARAIAERIGGK